jgi:signal transduction histidine kinase
LEQKINILLIEDNEEHAELFVRNLRLAQFYDASIKRAIDLGEGISSASNEKFDIIILDLGLPETQGLETLKAFQEQNLTTPIIVFTSSDDVELSLEAIRLGAQDFIFKGEFSPGVITRSIRYAMERFPLVRKLEVMNASLETFAFAAAHDLKSPLRNINAYLSFLQEDFNEDLSNASHEYIDVVTKSLTQLERLIESLLEFCKLGIDARILGICHLKDIVNEAISCLTEEIANSNALIHIEGDLPSVFVDKDLMVRVFLNLIGNSIKYTDNRIPKVRIEASEHENNHVISISDNGIGIDEEYLEKIFLPLERLHSQTSRYSGSGIGLAICSRIVEAHGGRIWAESKPGEGSVFYFTIPKWGHTQHP